MPSKKQRRRRAKERRHEYEYVYVDEEGHEVEVEPEEPEPKAAKADGKGGTRKASPQARGRAATTRGAVRPIPPPSWRRVFKRAAIFAPFMLIAISLLGGKKLTWAGRISETLALLFLFIPFSYLMDRMMYNRFVKQTGRGTRKKT